jgi:hypothetical protein
MFENSSVAAQLAVSQEGFSSMELVPTTTSASSSLMSL